MATEISVPGLTAAPPNVSDPAAGIDVITTDLNRSGGELRGSLNPKSPSENVWEPSSGIVMVLSWPDGALFNGGAG
ncbi:MAG: hypothetical protein EBS56_12835 [Planctomycetia bacterium]|nr:hypothetical protein [Planctomycetia bacterium]